MSFIEEMQDRFAEVYDNLNETIPHFPIVVSVVGLFILLALFFIFTQNPIVEEKTIVNVIVENPSGVKVRGADITVKGLEEEIKIRTDVDGKASFEAIVGANLDISVLKEGYAEYKKKIVAEKDKKVEVKLEALGGESQQASFTFVGPDKKSLAGKEVNVKLSCTGSGVFSQSQYTVSNGKLSVKIPENCGKVNVIAETAGMKTTNAAFLGLDNMVYFSGIEKPKGGIETKVRDSKNGDFVDGLNIKLVDFAGIQTGIEGITSFGEVSFNSVEVGRYTIIVSDPQGRYGGESEEVEVTENNVARKEISVSKDVKLIAEIIVSDDSGFPIEGANVKLWDLRGKIIGDKESDETGKVSFTFTESGTYEFLASKLGYIGNATKESFSTAEYAKGSTQRFESVLEQCTPEKCGTISARVLDEDELPIENARVVVLNEDGFVESQLGVRYTDYNGNIESFTGAAIGKYSLLVQKFPAEALSDEFEVDPLSDNFIEVLLVVGDGNVTISAKDEYGDPVGFADAEIFTDFGESLGKVSLDSDGSGSIHLKADKKVYAIIRQEGYSVYVTSARQVMPGAIIRFNAVLSSGLEGNAPEIEFLGFYSKNGNNSQSLKSGELYTAKLLFKVPRTDFDEAGVFLRTGGEGSIENDSLWIEEISAPLSGIEFGTAFNPPNGESEDSEGSGNAKWVLMRWENSEEGMYEIEAKVRVKKGLPLGTVLPFYYRAWGERSGSFLRDPVDHELNEAESTDSKAGVYAESHEKIYYEGLEDLCGESFCFNTRILDNTKGLYIEEPYNARVFSPYTLSFSITNDSETVYGSSSGGGGSGSSSNTDNNENDAVLWIESSDGARKSKDISINSYTIVNANAETLGLTKNVFETEKISLGSFKRNKTISGTLDLEPKSTGLNGLKFYITAENQVVMEKFIPLNVTSEKSLGVIVEPRVIAAFMPVELSVAVTSSDEDLADYPVEGAKVIVRKIASDRSESVFMGLTDAKGESVIAVPASSPGTVLKISVEKGGAVADVIERSIGLSVVTFSPTKINETLNRQTRTSAESDVRIKNIVQKDLKIREMRVVGNMKGVLDRGRMNTFLANNSGKGISAGKESEVKVLSALGSEALQLTKPVTVKGNIVTEFTMKGDESASWFAELPLEARVGLAELPSNAPCISISKKEWQDSTIGSRAELEFEIENNCISTAGLPMALDNLQAQIEWTGKDGIVGLTELSITDTKSGTTTSDILQNRVWTRVAEKVDAKSVYPARLTFTPKSDTLGKKAEFNVRIDAELLTDSGKEFVGSTNPIDAEIVVANLDQCIKIMPHPEEGIHMSRNQDDAEFTIDTSECGPISMDIRFCGGGDDMCRGGTDDGGLKLSSWQFTNIKEDARTVTVERTDIPGFYGITVEARPSGASWREVAEIATIVEPEEWEYFTMDKYVFTIIGDGSSDTANLTNTMLQEDVSVSANKCDWGAAQAGMDDGQKALIGMAGATAGIAVGILVASFAGGPIGAIVGLIVFVIIMIFSGIFGDDPCEKWETHTLEDYVINLAGTADPSGPRYIPPDALNIIMSDRKINAEWNLDITDAVQTVNSGNPNGRQIVGTIFTNEGVDSTGGSVYAVATMRATEHVHGDKLHKSAAVRCGYDGSESGDFGTFWINPGYCGQHGEVYNTTYTQKFHLKFKAGTEKATLPKLDFDTQACQSGTEIGRTGEGALPRVKLDWSWNEEANGISYNQCDVGNEDYVYCDATQFTIELNKKLYRLYEFLNENNFELGCPSVPENGSTTEQASKTRDVEEGSIGISKIEVVQSAAGINAKVSVKNNSAETANVSVKATAATQDGFEDSCMIELNGIESGAEKEGSCEIAGAWEEGAIIIASEIKITSDEESTDNTSLIAGIYLGDPNVKASQELCDFKTTETYAGIPQIMRFVDSKSDIKWTNKIRSRQDLIELLSFDAYLMKDNYSPEFFSDFSEHYTNNAFEDADFYFHSLAQNAEGKRFGINKFMDEGKFIVRRKFVDSSELPSAGIYNVEFAVYFDKDNWGFFDESGNLKSYIAMVIYKKSDPYPDSPFYSIPFDGLVGSNGSSYSRENYGAEYFNDSEELLQITGGTTPVKAYSSSENVGKTKVEVKRDLYSMNTSSSTRGMILEAKNTGQSTTITLQPSHATPVMIKTSLNEPVDEKFSAYYTVLENDSPVNLGNTFTYWSGAGACNDFTGVLVTEAFYEKNDRKAGASDKLLDSQNYYAIDWPRAVKSGYVYLRTIVYSDPRKDTVVKANSGANSEFLTADESGTAVALNGVSGMQFNNITAGSLGSVNTVSDVFNLVKEGKACVTNTGNSTKVFWNPQEVYIAKGTQRSVSELTNSLVAGFTCIG